MKIEKCTWGVGVQSEFGNKVGQIRSGGPSGGPGPGPGARGPEAGDDEIQIWDH